MRILVTGATGFVGQAILRRLREHPTAKLRGTVRHALDLLPLGIEAACIGDLARAPDLSEALAGIDAVVHAAGRAHIMGESPGESLLEFRRVNVGATLWLARQAVVAGVRRFIYLSSIKVNGEQTLPGQAYRADDVPAPIDAYGISKHEAEIGLRQISAETGLEVVVIRPVLVYGPGVGANFFSMLRWLYRGFPLPLGAVDNRRSLVALDNLVDLVVTCLQHRSAGGQTFLVSDDEDLSTRELVRRTAAVMGKSPWLVPLPPSALFWAARRLNREDLATRLCGSLRVDVDKTRSLLDWSPPVSMTDALASTVAWFLAGEAKKRRS